MQHKSAPSFDETPPASQRSSFSGSKYDGNNKDNPTGNPTGTGSLSTQQLSSKVKERTTEDSLNWRQMYVNMNAADVLACYAGIVDCVTDSNELEDVRIDATIQYYVVTNDDECRAAMLSNSKDFNPSTGTF